MCLISANCSIATFNNSAQVSYLFLGIRFGEAKPLRSGHGIGEDGEAFAQHVICHYETTRRRHPSMITLPICIANFIVDVAVKLECCE